MRILFIQTGGTIDKDYRAGIGVYNFEIGEPAAGRLMDRVNPSFEFRIVPLLQKDSQDISDEDRALIASLCEEAPEMSIVITHGTDTMVKTGEFLSKRNKDKVIVLTGASRPERFSLSDAHFNIGAAIGAFSGLKPGVYVSMSGRVLSWDHIAKDPKTGQFVER